MLIFAFGHLHTGDTDKLMNEQDFWSWLEKNHFRR